MLEDQAQQAQRHGGDHARLSTITAGQRQVQVSGNRQASRTRSHHLTGPLGGASASRPASEHGAMGQMARPDRSHEDR